MARIKVSASRMTKALLAAVTLIAIYLAIAAV
jgi:hypothetical protein